ncbi:hypothetical protein [Pantoea sp. Taur]|uniref:hypothetical protein n=1 Tax=Pantoea sp. Taur TaxID=2576757 RepID=UPI0013540C6F|nr:hypothetical protein [Pantoea sp. Taur]MXP61695.1 hypothetical protein [Pantoea sp. Taur]
MPNPMRCFNCLGFSHPTYQCKKQAVCANCGEDKHPENIKCENQQRCINCNGSHHALDRKCPLFIMQKEIKSIQVNNKVTFNEAKRIYKEKNPTYFIKSFAEIAKQNIEKKDVAVQADIVFNFEQNKNTTINNKVSTVVKVTSQASSSTASIAGSSYPDG